VGFPFKAIWRMASLFQVTWKLVDCESRCAVTLSVTAERCHYEIGAPNPFKPLVVNKKDASIRRNTCKCGQPMFNGPHINPQIRATTWDKDLGEPCTVQPRSGGGGGGGKKSRKATFKGGRRR
jgi:hypothetical protein